MSTCVPAPIGSPTAKRNEPATLCPSTVETLRHTTVYVPFSRGPTGTHIAVGSVGSNSVSPAVTVAPEVAKTKIELNAGSMGSVNQMITRSGAISSSSEGLGDASRRLACADADWSMNMVAKHAMNAKRKISLRTLRLRGVMGKGHSSSLALSDRS